MRCPRRLLVASAIAVATFAATGCGGSQVSSEEVPGPPPTLTVPQDPAVGGGSGSSGSGDTGTTAPEDTGASTDGAATDTGASAGAETPVAPEDTSTTAPDAGTATAPAEPTPEPTAPAAQTDAEQFEDFCAQNEGAC